MKMNYNIFKTNLKDKLDNTRCYEGTIDRYRSISIRRLERMLLNIDLVIEKIDWKIAFEVEHLVRIHLQKRLFRRALP